LPSRSIPAARRDPAAQYDWRVGVSRPFGNAEVHLNLSGGGPSRDHYADASHSRTAVTLGASLSF
jgi:hypothetical protein